MAKVISVLNMKGGVGKTTICLNLGYALANKKKKVLIVDFDPQANASGGLLTFEEYEKHRKNKRVISDIFSDLARIIGPVAKKEEPLITLEDMKTRARSFASGGYIDLVPSELELSHVLERSGGSSLEDRLKLILKNKKKQYDYVLVDCGPTYSVLTNNALKASDSVLIPVKPDPFSARGIPLLLSKISTHNLAHDGEDKVQTLGIVFNMVADYLVYQAGVKTEILKAHKDVFHTELRYTEHYPRGLIERKSIFEAGAQSQFTENFGDFVDEFLQRSGA